MKDYGFVNAAVEPKKMLVDVHSVWIADDVTQKTVTDEQGERVEYTYHLTEYSKDEYIMLMDKKNEQLSADVDSTQLALCEVYELLAGGE